MSDEDEADQYSSDEVATTKQQKMSSASSRSVSPTKDNSTHSYSANKLLESRMN